MTTIEPRYKSFIRPVKFWQRSQKTEDTINEKIPETKSFSVSKKVVPLVESHKTEVYKLSTVEDGGYMPPSPTLEGKRDHWIDVNEEMMDFNLPGSECLTSYLGEKHDFFTPSTLVESQPYTLPHLSSISLTTDSSMDDVYLSDE